VRSRIHGIADVTSPRAPRPAPSVSACVGKSLTIVLVLIVLFSLVPFKAYGAEAVVLLHGIANVPLSMKYLEKSIEEAGYSVHNLGYPSMEIPIGEAADRVREYVAALGPDVTVHFVAHSMGNLVVRRMFDKKLPNLGRMVMIAPPNQGSMLAQQLRDLDIYRWFFGPAGQQLPADRVEFFNTLPVPPCPFGIIAGGRGTEKGYNPLLPGDDDGTVRVEETLLAGAADFILINNTHTLILFDRETREQTIHFLKHGNFRK
jgi:pimeloyl-ACP methyl ester carboxylesterase